MKAVVGLITICILVSACKKKPEPVAPPPPQPAVSINTTPADPDAPPPPIPSGAEVGTGNRLDLVALNKIFKSYCATLDNGKPRGLGELVAAGYMDRLPDAPKGQHLEIDFKKMEVILVQD